MTHPRKRTTIPPTRDEEQCDPSADSLGHQCPPLFCTVAVTVNCTAPGREPVRRLQRDVGEPRQQREPVEDQCDAHVRRGGARDRERRGRSHRSGRRRRPLPVVVAEVLDVSAVVGATGAAGTAATGAVACSDVSCTPPGRTRARSPSAESQTILPATTELTTVHPGGDLGLGVLDDLSARLDRSELRLLRGQCVLLAADDRALVDVEACEEQHDDRRNGTADPEHPVGRQPGADGATSRPAGRCSGGRRLTASISAPPPDRSRRTVSRDRRGSRSHPAASTAVSGSAMRTRALTRRSSSSTSPGRRVVPPVTRISPIGRESGWLW